MSGTILHTLAFYRYLEHIIIFIFPYFLDKTTTIARIYFVILTDSLYNTNLHCIFLMIALIQSIFDKHFVKYKTYTFWHSKKDKFLKKRQKLH